MHYIHLCKYNLRKPSIVITHLILLPSEAGIDEDDASSKAQQQDRRDVKDKLPVK